MVVFHAGTKEANGDVVTSGGRVLAVTAYADSLEQAVRAAYAGVDTVTFEGKTFRRDIAHRYFFPKHSCNVRFLMKRQSLEGFHRIQIETFDVRAGRGVHRCRKRAC